MGNNSAPAHPAIPPIATTAAPLLNLTERDVNDTNKLTETLANMRNSLLVFKKTMDDKTIYELYASSIPSLVRLNTVALLNNDVWCCLSRLSEIEKTHNELIDAKIVDALVVALKTCETREMLDNVICTCGNLLTTKQGFDALVKNDDCVSCIVTSIVSSDSTIPLSLQCALNLVRNYEKTSEPQLAPLLSWLCQLLYKSFNARYYLDICSAIHCIALSNLNMVMDEIDLDFVFSVFVDKLDKCQQYGKIRNVLMKLAVDISGGTSQQSVRLTNAKGFDAFLWSFLQDPFIKNDVCCLLFNLSLGTIKQIQYLIDYKIVERLIELNSLDVGKCFQQDFPLIARNLLDRGSPEQVEYLKYHLTNNTIACPS